MGYSFLFSLKNSPITYIQGLCALAATLLAFILNGVLVRVRPLKRLFAGAGISSRTLLIIDSIRINPTVGSLFG